MCLLMVVLLNDVLMKAKVQKTVVAGKNIFKTLVHFTNLAIFAPAIKK
jgi:hypothetical protein